jgi:gas vesicle protein
MGEDPREVERRIVDTRERMGDTVEALSAKADVPARMRNYVGEKRGAVTSRFAGTTDDVTGRATDTARKGAGIAKENPLGLVVGSVAAGFLVGMLVPQTRVENERLGPIADQVKDQAREVGDEAVEHGKQIAQDAAHAATETAREAGRDHAAELQESVRDSARQAAEQVRS